MNKWTNRHWVKHGTIYLNIKDICTAIACVWRRSKAEKLRPYIYTTEKTLLGQTVTCTYSYLLNYVSIRHIVNKVYWLRKWISSCETVYT